MRRAYYEGSVGSFLVTSENEILGELTRHHQHDLGLLQRNAWIGQIQSLKTSLAGHGDGYLLLEFAIPRMGKRADAVLLSDGVVFVLEYKVGTRAYTRDASDQVLDYALDLKNFHRTSHTPPVVPVLVATDAPAVDPEVEWFPDGVAKPLHANDRTLSQILGLLRDGGHPRIDPSEWCAGRYQPTPTIVEAARALYQGHGVKEISRSEGGAINLSRTAEAIGEAIDSAKKNHRRIICFVTGVPGSGKTLAGLNLATDRMRVAEEEHAVFLSGNGPLVDVLREALARDEVERSKGDGLPIAKKDAQTKVRAFIQNIHHFRDDNLGTSTPPIEKVVVFDEAQRAWNREQTARFMREKRDQPSFDMSEPEFLLSVMDRHRDWCVVVCLIGGGQEINTGEAGLPAWFRALQVHYSHWQIYCSDQMSASEYSNVGQTTFELGGAELVWRPELHLGINVRSFRAEHLSHFVSAVVAGEAESAQEWMRKLDRYPLVLTRNVELARDWLRAQARGNERYGLVASSNALRLKPEGVHVKSKIQPPNWFLNGKDDVRSSFALEDVATEFDIQGLELDWVGVCWDANLRYVQNGWECYSFSGTEWMNTRDEVRRHYLVNSYRVLLTRARQGMVVFIPKGDSRDHTRSPQFYDGTYEFLRSCGVRELSI